MATTVHVREDRLVEVPFVPSRQERWLRRAELAAGVVLGVQAVVVLVLADASSVTLTSGSAPPAAGASAAAVATVPLAPLVAGGLAIPAAVHLGGASGWGFPRLVRAVRRRRNGLRALEQAALLGAFAPLVALLAGISAVGALVALAGSAVSAALLGSDAVVRPPPGARPAAWPLLVGGVVGLVPWAAIGLDVWAGPDRHGPPAYLPALAATAVAFAVGAALVTVLVRREVGPWRRSEAGEGTHLALTVAAASAVAWQVFANVLAP